MTCRVFVSRVRDVVFACLASVALWAGTATADPLALGYVVWDVSNPGVSGQFDIVNQTGPNASGDSTWPVDTPVSFSSLALTVHFSDGTSSAFGSGYFTTGGDGLSFDGTPIPIGAGVLPIDATLSGVFGTTHVSLFDGQAVTLAPSFTSTIALAAGGLADGALQLIEATPAVTTPVPEPETAGLMAIGLAVLALVRRGARRRAAGRHVATAAVVACVVAATPALAAVKLNAYAAPSSGIAGTTLVNITATGAPLAPSLPLQSATVTLAESCGGPAVGTVKASSSQWIVGSAYRIQFALPATLLARTYAASVTGTTAGGSAFASSNCSLVNVSAPAQGWKTLIGRSWTMPSQTVAYRCTLLQVTSDMYISAFRPVSPTGDFWKVLTVFDGAPSGLSVGDFNCSFGDGRTGKGVFSAGAGTGDFMLPAGTVMHVKPGQYLLLNIQVDNESIDAVTATSGIQVQTIDPAQVTAEAEMFFIGATQIQIPSDDQPHTFAGVCPYGPLADYTAFAVQPHMHGRGIRGAAEVLHDNVIQTIIDTPYASDAQGVIVIPALTVLAQHGVIEPSLLRALCTYRNNTGSVINFGESPDQEVCQIAVYRSPPEVIDSTGRGTAFGCIP